MAGEITQADLQNAKTDATTIAVFANGNADNVNPGQAVGTVTNRDGETFPVLQKLVADFSGVIADQEIQENAAAASATLAGHYANDDTDVDVPGGAAGERGAKYWNAQASGFADAAGAIADAAAAEVLTATLPGFAVNWEGSEGFEPLIHGRDNDAIMGIHHESLRTNFAFPVIAPPFEPVLIDRTTAAQVLPDWALSPGYGQSNSRGAGSSSRLLTTVAWFPGVALKFAEGVAPDVIVANAGVANPANPIPFNLGFVDLVSDNHSGDMTSVGAIGEGATPMAVNQLIRHTLMRGDRTLATMPRVVGSTAGFGSMPLNVLTSTNAGALNRWQRLVNHGASFAAQVPGGLTKAAIALRFHQGENNQDSIIGAGGAQNRANYVAELGVLRTGWRAESLARNTTASPVAAPILMWHVCYRNILPAGSTERVGLAQNDFAALYPDDTFIVGPDYQFDYSDDEFHQTPLGKAMMGALEGVATYFVVVKNKRWTGLRARTAWVEGDRLYLRMSGNFGPVRIRRIRDDLIANYGLKITDDTGQLTLSEPYLLADGATIGFHLNRAFNKASGSTAPLRIGIDQPRTISQWRVRNASLACEMGGTNICDSMTLANFQWEGEMLDNPNWLVPDVIDCTIINGGLS